MLDFFFMSKYLLEIYRGAQKKLCPAKKNTILVFFCWAQFFAPPSEWRPKRPPIPPVGKTAPGCVCLYMLAVCVSSHFVEVRKGPTNGESNDDLIQVIDNAAD